jgi:hypothetical protein
MNGAFMLMGDGNFFRDVTGLNPEHFVDDALESHLAASQLSVRRKKSRDRILSRARKNSRAKIGPSPSSSPSQGEGKRAERASRVKTIGETNLDEVGVQPTA